MLHGWCHVKCCRFGASSVYTLQPCTRLECHFIQSHIGRVCMCLAVTCHLHLCESNDCMPVYDCKWQLAIDSVVYQAIQAWKCVDTGRAENYGWYMPQVVGLSPTAPGEYVDVRERLTREYSSLLMSSDCRLYLGWWNFW